MRILKNRGTALFHGFVTPECFLFLFEMDIPERCNAKFCSDIEPCFFLSGLRR